MEIHEQVYFASSNTTNGFQNYFDIIFDPEKLRSIYILKGGPGTGKSTLMKAIAVYAEELGHDVERFLCSSDPSSLDGIIITDIAVAIVDGTAPHIKDTKYPGVIESIINTGQYWDKNKLSEKKSEILELIKTKNRYYQRAYQFLKALNEVENEITKIGEISFQNEKMKKSIERTLRQLIGNESDPKREIRLTETFNRKGFNTLFSYYHSAEKIYVIEDACNSAHRYLSQLHQILLESNVSTTLSYSALCPNQINAILLPKKKTAFVIGKREYENEIPNKEYHYINMKRFINTDVLRQNKQKVRFGKKCSDMLRQGAKDAFEEAWRSHCTLEEIYCSAMDYTGIINTVENLKNELFL